jgi:hypothetical protein
MSLDHALAADAQREDVLAFSLEPVRAHRDGALEILVGVDGHARGDAPEHGDVRREPALALGALGEDQRARHALARGASVKHALALQGPEMIEGGPGGEAEALADLAHRRRRPVLLCEAPDEGQHFALPRCHLPHRVGSSSPTGGHGSTGQQ